jgi:Fic family protein
MVAKNSLLQSPQLTLPDIASVETHAVLKALAEAHRHLAELKGLTESLPNGALLVETLAIQEAKDSSEIENIITTHDELYASAGNGVGTPAAKEVKHYVAALRVGSDLVMQERVIRLSTILAVQAEIEQNRAGLRKVPGTVLKNPATGKTIYEPPQSAVDVERLMNELVDFIHANDKLDPLLRMAIAHHQFESIHPFYDGNGRTGRVLNLLILQREELLDLPVLYLSRYITSTKADYYRLLQSTRDTGDWAAWCLYIVKGVALTAKSGIDLIKALRDLMMKTKQRLRTALPKSYSQELLNNLFRYPYTKIEFVEKDLGVSRITAARHLDLLADNGFVKKQKIGRANFYINEPLYALLTNVYLPNE